MHDDSTTRRRELLPDAAGTVTRAVGVLRSGGLVAFPTETVYGLGADAENEAAVGAVFRVKGRPRAHPLIVHLAHRSMLPAWGRELPDVVHRLAEAFWPGPLTLIVKRSTRAIDAVTGGADTVGLRVPAHPLALALLEEFGGGVAAPSANRFGAVSPTRAEHVRVDLGADVDFVLDGGDCSVGVESTIVDLSRRQPVILRPGGITPEQLAAAAGAPLPVLGEAGETPAPGTLPSHYAPRARVVIVDPADLSSRLERERSSGLCAGSIDAASLPPESAARQLYAQLRALDDAGCDVVLVTLPTEAGLGWAVADRLRKAAGPRG